MQTTKTALRNWDLLFQTNSKSKVPPGWVDSAAPVISIFLLCSPQRVRSFLSFSPLVPRMAASITTSHNKHPSFCLLSMGRKASWEALPPASLLSYLTGQNCNICPFLNQPTARGKKYQDKLKLPTGPLGLRKGPNSPEQTIIQHLYKWAILSTSNQPHLPQLPQMLYSVCSDHVEIKSPTSQ